MQFQPVLHSPLADENIQLLSTGGGRAPHCCSPPNPRDGVLRRADDALGLAGLRQRRLHRPQPRRPPGAAASSSGGCLGLRRGKETGTTTNGVRSASSRGSARLHRRLGRPHAGRASSTGSTSMRRENGWRGRLIYFWVARAR
jgi:hypothetical protein